MAMTPLVRVLGTVLKAHSYIHRRSGGRFGRRIGGRPALLLHTVGRKSGLPRTTTLTYARDGDRYLLVASKGGSDLHPDWYLNLVADPGAAIRVDGADLDVTAEVLSGAERDRAWAVADAANRGWYSRYQRSTEREIPVVALIVA